MKIEALNRLQSSQKEELERRLDELSDKIDYATDHGYTDTAATKERKEILRKLNNKQLTAKEK